MHILLESTRKTARPVCLFWFLNVNSGEVVAFHSIACTCCGGLAAVMF